MTRRSLGSGLVFVLLLVLALPLPAGSLELETAKKTGLIGERADGFIGVVNANPAPELVALADSVNAQRRKRYEEVARKNGAPVDAVAALAGAKLIERVLPGQWVTDAEGNWYRK